MEQFRGPTEIAGRRIREVDGYRIVFYPDAGNPTRPGCEASRFHWMPDRLYLGREGSGYDFSFTRYAAPDQGDVCGMVRFSLTMGLPSGVVDKATRMLSESEPKTDPYWGSRYYYREAYTPLTFRYTHTTLSDVAAGSDRIARTLPGAAPWYCENQGADTGPLQATESRSYTTLLGRYHTELFHQAVVQDTQSAPAVNRALGIEFQAPVNSFSLAADWPAVREELLRGTRGAERDVTLDQIRGAVRRLREAGKLAADCVLDPSVPKEDPYRTNLLTSSGCVDGRFLELARATVLDAPDNRPTALASDADGPPNPWGGSWKVTDGDSPCRTADTDTEGPFTYLRPLTVTTRFLTEFQEMRATPKKYFPTVYPGDMNHTLCRVFRPVMSHDNPAVSTLSVLCGYPDTTGKIVWEGHAFSRPDHPDDDPQPWTYSTVQKSAGDVHDPPPGWAPDRTFIKRQVRLRDSSEATGELCVVHNDITEADIDQGDDGTLFNDIAIDISAAMVRHLDVHPIRLFRKIGPGESVSVAFEALDAAGRPDGIHTAEFRWTEGDQRPRRWIVFPAAVDFPAAFRYRATVHDHRGTRPGPWIRSSGSGPIHLFVLPAAKP